MIDIKLLLISSLKESLTIVSIIFVLMIMIEIFVLKYKDSIIKFSRKNKFLEYLTSSFFGIIPGCVGTFTMDSLYMAGLLSFGGIVAVMISTSGDEALLLISMAFKNTIPWTNIAFLFSILFVLGITGGFIADYYQRKTKIKFCEKCGITNHHKDEFNPIHFFKEHIYKHIIKKHLWQIFIWIFVAIFIIGLFNNQINLSLSGTNMLYVLILASLIGLLPLSGPNVFLIIMFSEGLLPFSIILANSIIQDGHGLLPIMGFSVKDAIKIKLYNFIFGLTIGLLLLSIGL